MSKKIQQSKRKRALNVRKAIYKAKHYSLLQQLKAEWKFK